VLSSVLKALATGFSREALSTKSKLIDAFDHQRGVMIMLVIKIEVHPAGSEMHAFEIGRLELENISGLADVSDYNARITQLETRHLGVLPFDRCINISGHPRSDGPWSLVKRVLDHIHLSASTQA